MNAGQMINAITWVEVSSRYDADCRRVLREERESLTAAVQSGDRSAIGAAMAEATRVAQMWDVDLAHVEMPD